MRQNSSRVSIEGSGTAAKQNKIKTVMQLTSLSNGTVMRLKSSLDTNDHFTLKRLLHPAENRAGAKNVLTAVEEQIFKNKIKDVAVRGFAIDVPTLPTIIGAAVTDGRPGFTNGMPSESIIRSFRARHRDITCRNYEKREFAKLKEESFPHVQSFEMALRRVEKSNPGIFDRGEHLWNLDETKVSGEFGRKTKVFGPLSTSHGGFRATQSNAGSGKHLTAVIVTSAAGHVLPPFFIFAGTNQMKKWFEPLHEEIFKDEVGAPHWLTRKNWYPNDACLVASQNGSMEKCLLPLLVEHVNVNVSKIVPQDTKICLTLDGHSSRNGWDWLEQCISKNIEVVQSPANTSHFLQLCDQRISKTFQLNIRKTVDQISRYAVIDLSNMGIKLKLGIAGYNAITVDTVRRSFEVCGLWPMDYRFMDKFKGSETKVVSTLKKNAEKFRTVTLQRRTDVETYGDIKKIVSSPKPPSVKIDELFSLLKQHRTLSSILDEYTESQKPVVVGTKSVITRQTREVLCTGTPAIYMTHADLIRKRKERQSAVEEAERNTSEREIRKRPGKGSN